MLCTLLRWSANILLLLILCAGCVPVPVSTVALHPRQERSFALELVSENVYWPFTALTYDATGTLIAVYDSSSDVIRILRSTDGQEVKRLKPNRWPQRLSFSPSGRYLVIEQHGWINDALKHKKNETVSHISVDAPDAIHDDIEKVTIWDLNSGGISPELQCDAIVTTEPEGGWLWAKQWAIRPGYRSSPLREGHFSRDEKEFSVLCRNGVQQRWQGQTWKRLADIPPPPFWHNQMEVHRAQWLADGDTDRGFVDGRIAVFRPSSIKEALPPALYLWEKNNPQVHQLPEGFNEDLLRVPAISRNGKTVAFKCGSGLGFSIRVFDLVTGKELPIEEAEFGFAAGMPMISQGGVALSTDGKYLAVAVLRQTVALLPNVLLVPAGVTRSDLRLWDVNSGKELVTVSIDDLVGNPNFFHGVSLAFSPDGTTLVVAGRRLRLYRVDELIGQR